MEFEVKNIGKVSVLRLKEDIDSHNYTELEETIRMVYESDVRNLVVNLERVKHINSLGLGVLCQFNRKAKAEEKTFKLASVPSEVREIMEITRLTEFLDIYDSVKEALGSLG